MKIKSTLFCAALMAGFGASAQVWVADSVTMGPGYVNDVYYGMSAGAVKTESNKNWSLAFQMTPPGPYGNVSVWANHVQDTISVYSLNLSASAKFATLSAADTMGKTAPSQALFNTDSSWNFGAFNRMGSVTNPFDYSWGTYNINTHDVNGDSLYLLKAGPGQIWKMWIQQFKSSPADSVRWTFRIARWDGSQDTTISIYRKQGYTDRLFAYYNLRNRTVLDREPSRTAWDMLFTRYKEYITGAPGSPYYNVTGVLTNFGRTVADVRGVNPDTAQYQNYVRTTKLNEIGSDWKVFNQSTNSYTVDPTITFFIKATSSAEYYQLAFTSFDYTVGKIVFRKRALGATAVADVKAPVAAFGIAPNPANTAAELMIDARNGGTTRIQLTDMSGRVVFTATPELHAGMNGYSIATGHLPAGVYSVSIAQGTWKGAQRLVVAH